jgi:hypothetical protein
MEGGKRSTPRHRVLKAATISFGGGAISCTVRNLSDSGASLEVASPIGIPDTFAIGIEGGARRCRVIWRKEKRIGVRFIQPSTRIISSPHGRQ